MANQSKPTATSIKATSAANLSSVVVADNKVVGVLGEMEPNGDLAYKILASEDGRVRMPDKLATLLNNIPNELLGLDEGQLLSAKKFTAIDERIRLAFWKAVHQAQHINGRLAVKDICAGVCSESYFYNLMRDPLKAAYIVTEVASYNRQVESLLSMAVRRLEEVVQMDITSQKKVEIGTDEEGNPQYEYVRETDPVKVKVLMEAIGKLENRVLGNTVQKTVIESNSTTTTNVVGKLDSDTINNEIKLLKEKLDS